VRTSSGPRRCCNRAGVPHILLPVQTICDFKTLTTNLAEVRDKGFAVGDEELNPRCRGIGAPLFGQGGSVVASVAVAGSITDISSGRIRTLVNDLLSTMEEISEEHTLAMDSDSEI
jgi:DNA-binding IclR family transcriptional regulator